ncbi:hypothetical protein SKAU_G00036150 [Synaphobranchus kaupii]|uniref:Uncharacterized protein n=1 Tax=Synaphobranchus kaupii TaxID=118154 RepID=A0A9Q1GF96_SYNKA|nr:hypothetical protein SKAU_G00036150 [Synaphobranchus kaupii]
MAAPHWQVPPTRPTPQHTHSSERLIVFTCRPRRCDLTPSIRDSAKVPARALRGNRHVKPPCLFFSRRARILEPDMGRGLPFDQSACASPPIRERGSGFHTGAAGVPPQDNPIRNGASQGSVGIGRRPDREQQACELGSTGRKDNTMGQILEKPGGFFLFQSELKPCCLGETDWKQGKLEKRGAIPAGRPPSDGRIYRFLSRSESAGPHCWEKREDKAAFKERDYPRWSPTELFGGRERDEQRF